MLGWDSDFERFKNTLANGLNRGLPGVEAQYKSVPPSRVRPNFEKIERQNPKRAGVLALFYPVENVPHLVLMKRNSYPGVHSDQISLPGGKHEKSDKDLVATALRETQEEIGVHPSIIEIAGNLTKVFIPPSNFLVQPVIGFCATQPLFLPDKTEVAQLLEVPFFQFASHENFRETEVFARDLTMLVPAYHINNHVVWGATAMMISELLALLESGE